MADVSTPDIVQLVMGPQHRQITAEFWARRGWLMVQLPLSDLSDEACRDDVPTYFLIPDPDVLKEAGYAG